MTERITALATLMIHSRIILRSSIHTDRDSDHLARPSMGAAFAVMANEFSHDTRVFFFGTGDRIVDGVEFEVEIVLF